MDESTNRMIWLAIGLAVLAITLYLFISIFLTFYQPYERIAIANTERLRAAMDEACLNKNGVVELDSFDLQQNTPFPSFFYIADALPAWMMRLYGDPKYVLYYEAFPPGEGVGWEVYQDHNYRLLTPLPEGLDTNKNSKYAVDPALYAEDQFKRFTQLRPNAEVDAILLNNVILNANYKPEYITRQYALQSNIQSTDSGALLQPQVGASGESLKDVFYNFGKWQTDSNNDGLGDNIAHNVFIFNNYRGLSKAQQSLIKYMPCGDNSLCLKTTSGVHRYPLTQCGDIKNVQVIYDARLGVVGRTVTVAGIAVGTVVAIKIAAPVFTVGRFLFSLIPSLPAKIVVGGAAAGGATTGAYLAGTEIVQYAGTAFLAFKTSDLAISSPCAIRSEDRNDPAIKIKYTDCTSTELGGVNHCSTVAKYSLYEYTEEGGFKATNDHYVCLEKADSGALGELDEDGYGTGDKCIQIFVKEPAVGCWTPDPYKPDIFLSDTQLITSLLGITPIRDGLNFLADDDKDLSWVTVLNPSSEEELNDFLGRWEKKISWGWPWVFSQ